MTALTQSFSKTSYRNIIMLGQASLDALTTMRCDAEETFTRNEALKMYHK